MPRKITYLLLVCLLRVSSAESDSSQKTVHSLLAPKSFPNRIQSAVLSTHSLSFPESPDTRDSRKEYPQLLQIRNGNCSFIDSPQKTNSFINTLFTNEERSEDGFNLEYVTGKINGLLRVLSSYQASKEGENKYTTVKSTDEGLTFNPDEPRNISFVYDPTDPLLSRNISGLDLVMFNPLNLKQFPPRLRMLLFQISLARSLVNFPETDDHEEMQSRVTDFELTLTLLLLQEESGITEKLSELHFGYGAPEQAKVQEVNSRAQASLGVLEELIGALETSGASGDYKTRLSQLHGRCKQFAFEKILALGRLRFFVPIADDKAPIVGMDCRVPDIYIPVSGEKSPLKSEAFLTTFFGSRKDAYPPGYVQGNNRVVHFCEDVVAKTPHTPYFAEQYQNGFSAQVLTNEYAENSTLLGTTVMIHPVVLLSFKDGMALPPTLKIIRDEHLIVEEKGHRGELDHQLKDAVSRLELNTASRLVYAWGKTMRRLVDNNMFPEQPTFLVVKGTGEEIEVRITDHHSFYDLSKMPNKDTAIQEMLDRIISSVLTIPVEANGYQEHVKEILKRLLEMGFYGGFRNISYNYPLLEQESIAHVSRSLPAFNGVMAGQKTLFRISDPPEDLQVDTEGILANLESNFPEERERQMLCNMFGVTSFRELLQAELSRGIQIRWNVLAAHDKNRKRAATRLPDSALGGLRYDPDIMGGAGVSPVHKLLLMLNQAIKQEMDTQYPLEGDEDMFKRDLAYLMNHVSRLGMITPVHSRIRSLSSLIEESLPGELHESLERFLMGYFPSKLNFGLVTFRTVNGKVFPHYQFTTHIPAYDALHYLYPTIIRLAKGQTWGARASRIRTMFFSNHFVLKRARHSRTGYESQEVQAELGERSSGAHSTFLPLQYGLLTMTDGTNTEEYYIEEKYQGGDAGYQLARLLLGSRRNAAESMIQNQFFNVLDHFRRMNITPVNASWGIADDQMVNLLDYESFSEGFDLNEIVTDIFRPYFPKEHQTQELAEAIEFFISVFNRTERLDVQRPESMNRAS
ncbi:MAG: hypothetical protein JW774_01420 [Candidatus Aureabacteria bacterium]|nr:hypothetical protein [Candidatus Auribacterota bacterium]